MFFYIAFSYGWRSFVPSSRLSVGGRCAAQSNLIHSASRVNVTVTCENGKDWIDAGSLNELLNQGTKEIKKMFKIVLLPICHLCPIRV